ncbi:hypothetical protein SteCoe_1607 [Stentor coeruleus]|uniref:Protein kinase domain-containing protein n=1 Tax=Stentor coeruleus TaxID=5963 RepID=A0A1R2D1C5_9CILI|nr:hypothetical protein SteCoe_1607 [Stentor coeruleus]
MDSSSKLSPQLRTSTSQRIIMTNKLEKKYQNCLKLKPNLKLCSVAVNSPNSSLTNVSNLTKNKSLELAPLKSKGLISQKPSLNFVTSHKILFTEKDVRSEFMLELNDYERQEIKLYTDVVYAGKKQNKIEPNPMGKNYNFDTENGNYRLIKGDHIAYRFEIVTFIGKGAFGVVCECIDHKYNERVAVKILKNKKCFHRQGNVEINILKVVNENDESNTHTVKMISNFIFRNHICLVFELLFCNLYEYLKLNNMQGLKVKLIKNFVQQILQTLKYLESLMIIHCDIKLENLVLVSKTSNALKLIDFGSSCYQYDKIYSYIQSRYYRSPEVILGIPYTSSIDMWSLGCVIAELYTGKVLLPGDNEKNQLMLIIELLGLPPEYLINKSPRKKLFFNKDNTFKYTTFTDSRPLIPGSRKIIWPDNYIWDFVKSCLHWDPEYRLTPSQGLYHPWMQYQNKRALPKIKIQSKFKINEKSK